MGQCSTLPTEGRTASSNKRGDSSMTQRQDKYQHKAPNAKRVSTLHVQTQNANSQGNTFPHGHHDPAQPQTRNPDSNASSIQPMEEDDARDGIPQPPEIAVRTRCYKLNLDSEINSQQTIFLGPFSDAPPPLTYSSSEDSTAHVSPVQIAVQTAKIFRGITVAKDGTILSQNARATRSNRGAKNKRGEKSRQATKIEKAKDLVEESIRTGKAPDSDEPANMMSLVIMGEYDDMKYLVRDGAKKLRDSVELSEDSLVAVNRGRPGMRQPIQSGSSPRKRVSPNYVGSQRGTALTPSKSRTVGNFQNAPPKLKSNPREGPTLRRPDEKGGIHDENAGGGDWSHTLSFSRGFHSIWNCGGTGEDTGTVSPTQVGSPKDGKSAHAVGVPPNTYRPVFEGRDTNYSGQARDASVAARAN